MKSLLKFSALFALLIGISVSSFAQTESVEEMPKAEVNLSNLPVEIKFPVKGVCNMCKKRIENAAYIKGVKLVEWEKETQMLSVIYKPSKVSVQEIHEAVAEIGHATSEVAANTEAYAKLPGCCKYDDGIKVH